MSRVLDLIKSVAGNGTNADATTTNTPTATDNSKKVVNTEWAKLGFAISKASPGYVKLPTWMGGLVVQWGVADAAASASTSVSVPLPWPTAVLWATGNVGVPIVAGNWTVGVGPRPSFPDQILIQNTDVVNHGVYWLAIGH